MRDTVPSIDQYMACWKVKIRWNAVQFKNWAALPTIKNRLGSYFASVSKIKHYVAYYASSDKSHTKALLGMASRDPHKVVNLCTENQNRQKLMGNKQVVKIITNSFYIGKGHWEGWSIQKRQLEQQLGQRKQWVTLSSIEMSPHLLWKSLGLHRHVTSSRWLRVAFGRIGVDGKNVTPSLEWRYGWTQHISQRENKETKQFFLASYDELRPMAIAGYIFYIFISVVLEDALSLGWWTLSRVGFQSRWLFIGSCRDERSWEWHLGR